MEPECYQSDQSSMAQRLSGLKFYSQVYTRHRVIQNTPQGLALHKVSSESQNQTQIKITIQNTSKFGIRKVSKPGDPAEFVQVRSNPPFWQTLSPSAGPSFSLLSLKVLGLASLI